MANPVQQSGNISQGHVATWVADGVIADGGAAPAAQRVLASLRSADFNVTTDQPIVIPQRITAFQLTSIVITNPSTSLNVAVGGFYPASAKGGPPIVAASQVYSALSVVGTSLMTATLASFGANTRFSSANLALVGNLLAIWFSLTTPQGLAATADIYLVGIDLS